MLNKLLATSMIIFLFSCSTLSGGTHQKVNFISDDPLITMAIYPHYMYPRKPLYVGSLPVELELSRKTFYKADIIVSGETIKTIDIKPKNNHTDAVTFALVPGLSLADSLISGGGMSYPETIIFNQEE